MSEHFLDSLLEQHRNLNKNRHHLSDEDILEQAYSILSHIRAAGRYVTDPEQRNVLTNVALDLGELIFRISDSFPSVRLEPTNIFEVSSTNNEGEPQDLILTSVSNNFLGTNAGSHRIKNLNRQVMLDKVKAFWIEGVLEQSLYKQLSIDIKFDFSSGSVKRPWDTILQTPERLPLALQKTTKIIDLFDEVGRSLLILGDPGSGKTTMLLQLARESIIRAEQDNAYPIPTVFHLHSWQGRQSIAQWLEDELAIRYLIPRNIGHDWIQNQELMILLDGLDEVKLELREECINSLNQFHGEYPLTSLVVCSRKDDYDNLTSRLNLQNAILLLPLTEEQIENYVTGAHNIKNAEKIYELIKTDEVFKKIAQSPLMLNLMMLAYPQVPSSDLEGLESNEAYCRHLFDAYTQQMFKRRLAVQKFSQTETIKRLSWLARRMLEHSQTIVSVGNIQPSWLSSRLDRWLYVLLSRLVSGLILGLILGMGLYIGGTREYIVFGVLGGIIIGIVDGIRLERLESRINVFTNDLFSWHLLSRPLLIWVLVAIVLSLIFGFTSNAPAYEKVVFGILPLSAISLGVLVGCFFAAVFGSKRHVQSFDKDIQPSELIRWSWYEAMIGSARVGVGGGISGVLIASIVLVTNSPTRDWLISQSEKLPSNLAGQTIGALFWGLFLGILCGVVFGAVLGGTRGSMLEHEDPTKDGISLSLRNAGLVAVRVGSILALMWGLMYWIPSETSVGLLRGIGSGLAGGILTALWYSGLDVIKHYVLRLYLFSSGNIPINLSEFLDYASERTLLRRVGGGYIFVHRLLLEHFANIEAVNQQQKKSSFNTLIVTILSVIVIISCALIISTVNLQMLFVDFNKPGNMSGIYEEINIGNKNYQSNVQVKSGQYIYIYARGKVNTGYFVTNISPDGTHSGLFGFPIGNEYNLKPEFAHGALLCRISDKQEWQFCGAKAIFEASLDGYLEFAINDIESEKHSGAFYVTIQIMNKH